MARKQQKLDRLKSELNQLRDTTGSQLVQLQEFLLGFEQDIRVEVTKKTEAKTQWEKSAAASEHEHQFLQGQGVPQGIAESPMATGSDLHLSQYNYEFNQKRQQASASQKRGSRLKEIKKPGSFLNNLAQSSSELYKDTSSGPEEVLKTRKVKKPQLGASTSLTDILNFDFAKKK